MTDTPSLRAGLEHLRDLLLEELREHYEDQPTANYCWWCLQDVNGMGMDEPQPHLPTCWRVRVRSALEAVADLLRAQPPPAPDPPRWVHVNTLAVQQHVQAGHRMTCDCGADFQFAWLAAPPAVEGTRPPDPETP